MPRKGKGTFLRFVTSAESERLWKHPDAFLLANVIAWRQRDSMWQGTGGKAYLGDYRELGLTRKRYRNAVRLLELRAIARFEVRAGVGTVATLVDTRVYDLSAVSYREMGHQMGHVEGQLNGRKGATLSHAASKTSKEKRQEKGQLNDRCRATCRATIEKTMKKTIKKRKKEKAVDGDEIRKLFVKLLAAGDFERVDTAEFREAYMDWIAYREERHAADGKKSLVTSVVMARDLKHAKKTGARVAVAELERAMNSGYVGWYGWPGYKSPREEDLPGPEGSGGDGMLATRLSAIEGFFEREG